MWSQKAERCSRLLIADRARPAGNDRRSGRNSFKAPTLIHAEIHILLARTNTDFRPEWRRTRTNGDQRGRLVVISYHNVVPLRVASCSHTLYHRVFGSVTRECRPSSSISLGLPALVIKKVFKLVVCSDGRQEFWVAEVPKKSTMRRGTKRIRVHRHCKQQASKVSVITRLNARYFLSHKDSTGG
jgi:hypothetical protein